MSTRSRLKDYDVAFVANTDAHSNLTFCPGDFLKVLLSDFESHNPSHRARHSITDYESFSGDPPAIVVQRFPKVVLKTTAEVEPPVNGVKMLSNEVFGCFVDLDGITRGTVGDLVEFEFTCVSSPLNKYSSIFVPRRIIRTIQNRPSRNVFSRNESSGNTRKIYRGLVSHQADCVRFVWCVDFHDDVVLNKPVEISKLIGKWIEFEVTHGAGKRNFVSKFHGVIDDLIETKVEKDRFALVRVDLKYCGDSDDGLLKLEHPYIGSVVDFRCFLPDSLEVGSFVETWVAPHRRESQVSRWGIRGPPLNIYSGNSSYCSAPTNPRGTSNRSSWDEVRPSKSSYSEEEYSSCRDDDKSVSSTVKTTTKEPHSTSNNSSASAAEVELKRLRELFALLMNDKYISDVVMDFDENVHYEVINILLS
ncbi:unnamed protein product [Caenorhabditis auriculariae]|uniref:Uncharacterized protein n=1 Tax=Caenorhabditis auriculariae TaxID=2777116 RepID=A0A8S1H6T8_9PELO|nr:unnamed protein product [Caenorhabditis auriculariae]